MCYECCDDTKNLIPIIYEYYDKHSRKLFGVSHFVCSSCFSNICVDDTFDKYADQYTNLRDYIKCTLQNYEISEFT